MTIQRLYNHVRKHQERTGQRAGQSAFNCLEMVRPAIANAIRGTDADPFNDDSRLDLFWGKVYELWW